MGAGDGDGEVWRVERAGRRPVSQDAEALGRLVDEDHDPAETEYYEALADSDVQALDDAQRSHAGQYLRRLRRLRSRSHYRDKRR